MVHNPGKIAVLKKEVGDLFTLEKRDLSGLWMGVFVAVAFLVRLPFIFFPEVIYNDGVEYIRVAKHILGGNWSEGFVPPVYPALVAALGFIVRDFERAGILISVMLGALIVLPVYHFTKKVFDGRTAILAAIFAVFQPLFYVYSGSVLTESTYYFIVAMIALYGWLAFTKGRVIHILLFGFFVAMAYLTKPEGIGFLFIFLAWTLCANPPAGEKRFVLTRVWMAALAVTCFTVVSLPYLIQIRNDLGSWQLSKKAAVSVGGLQHEEDNGLSEDGQQHPKRRVDVGAYLKSPFSLVGKISSGFFESLFKFQQGFTPYLFLFAIVGFLVPVNRHYPWKPNLYALSHVVFFFGLVLPFFWITKRYTSQMIPLLLPWAAWGFWNILSWFSKRVCSSQGRLQGFSALCVGIVVLALLTQGILSSGRGHRQIQKDVGLWMKANLPGDAKVMSRLPQEGYYAQRPWTRIRKGSYNEIVADAQVQGVSYLVIDDAILRDVTDFRENITRGDLTLVKAWGRGSRRILLFRTIGTGNS